MMIHCNILHYISWFVKRVYTLFFLFAAIFFSTVYISVLRISSILTSLLFERTIILIYLPRGVYMAMELSVWSDYYFDLPPEEAVLRFLSCGIRAIELGTGHGEMLIERGDPTSVGKAFGRFAKEHGMQITQGHLWLKARIVSNPEAVSILNNWIDLYEAIGIRNMVLHMDVYNMEEKSIDEMHHLNVEKLKILADHIQGRNIYICLENLFRRGADHIEQLLSVIERIDSPQFGITLDTGHLNMVKTASQHDFILAAGEKLRAIHIADNDGSADQHLIPFGKGTVDFAEVVRALRKVGYKGVFNYEIPGESHVPLPIRDRKLLYIRDTYHYLMEQ